MNELLILWWNLHNRFGNFPWADIIEVYRFMNITSLLQFKYVTLLLSASLFSLLFILKVPSLVLQSMAEKVKHTRAIGRRRREEKEEISQQILFFFKPVLLCFILLFAICYIKTLLVNMYEFIKAWTETSLRMKYINITSWIIFGWSFLLCCTLTKPSCKYIVMFVSNRNVIWIISSVPQKSPFSVVNKGVDIVMPFACILMFVCVCLFSCLSQRNREWEDGVGLPSLLNLWVCREVSLTQAD